MAYTTIKKPSSYFNTKLYSGNSSTQSITGVGFQPDWTWIKQRNGTNYHTVFDIARGTTKRLFPNATDAEDTAGSTLTSFDSDGFTLDANAGVNGSGNTFASWNWLGSNTTASNTDGSITSTVSANTTSGFSIATYTGNGTAGADIGHGLGDTPACVIIKPRTTTGNDNWIVYHKSLGTGNYLYLNTTDASSSAGGAWLTPSSSTIEFTQSFAVTNNSGSDFVCYSFAEKQGFSKFGSYTGNGNADGTFVYTGFKPAFIITKRTDSSAGSYWVMYDNKRDPHNEMDKYLYSYDASAENSGVAIDFLSNGFKPRVSNLIHNGSGATYIYMAFAEEPLVGDNPCTAR
jgi:hypothetical protein